jgi:hypothetical protein
VGHLSFCMRASSIASSPQTQTRKAKSGDKVRIAVLGASGYTGAEVVMLL